MPKFRKRPVIIDAEQWFPDKPVDGVIFPIPDGIISILGEPYEPDVGLIYTLEGYHTVNSGDWVITGVQGEKYPIKPDIFEATYEELDSNDE